MSEYRKLPKVDALARDASLAIYPERTRVAAARHAVADLRGRVQAGEAIGPDDALRLAVDEAERLSASAPQLAINLSGVVLHTGLGRARLAASVAQRVAAVARDHAAVEFDLETGSRGDRQDHVRDMLRELTGAEDAIVVNNAAAGVFLTLASLASSKEVVLSRGQMVEIGGSFRMPDIVRQSGCRLVEVGCTNKTRLSDYAQVLGPETGAILRCHPSNFRIVGFTEEPTIAELAGLARSAGLPLLDDQGNGCLVDTRAFGLPKEPTLAESVRDGADVTIASGDKLLGGPQAGMIVGRRDLIAIIRRHPLARAVRVDKLTLAALEATLRLYLEGREGEIPTLAYLARSPDEIKRMVTRLARAYRGTTCIAKGQTEVGGGSAPGVGLPTYRLGLLSDDPKGLAGRLRGGTPAIIGRIENDIVWLDPRTLETRELAAVERALREL